MLDEMAGETFIGWRRYYNVEPWGEERADLRSALHGLATCMVAGGKGLNLEMFMPVREQIEEQAEREEQTPAQMVNVAHMIVALQAGRLSGKCQQASAHSSST
jgi:hypothetical protein